MENLSNNSLGVILAFERGYRVINGVVFNPSGNEVKGFTQNARGVFYRVFSIRIPQGERGRGNVHVHRLLAYQKFGPVIFAEGVQVRHLDGNSLNNQESNITTGSARDNCMDKPLNVRQYVSSKANRKHSDEMIASMREDKAQGMRFRDLLLKYKVPKSTLSYYLSTKAKRTSWSLPIAAATPETQDAWHSQG